MNKILAGMIFGNGAGGGGGGSSTYTKKGLASYTIKPIDAQYVTDAYKGTSYNDETLANCPSISNFYALFYDRYLSSNLQDPLPNYSVTKKSLGKDQSGTYDLWEYDFCPANWDRMIMISSGMNGYEVGAIFGLAYFLEEIVERHTGDALLTYLYEHVRIKVIPLINPWGYAQSPKKYVNSRGVNINRNVDYNGSWEDYDGGSNPNNNKGTAPWSEAETKILRQWASDNYGTEFWIDCHTGLQTTDKELYTSSLTTSPYYSKVVSAHTKLENWAMSFYELQSVTPNYLWDSAGATKGRWYEGTYGIPTMTLEQCSKITSTGQLYNGEAKSFINYEAQLYGYVGEFLLKADETVVSNTYIEQLQQSAIEDKKYLAPYEDEPTPTVTEVTVKQGTLKSTDGTPTSDNMTRVYIEDYLPVSHSDFHVKGIGTTYWFGGRMYTQSDDFTTVVASEASDKTVGFLNSAEHSTSWGIAQDVTIRIGSQKTATCKKIRLVLRTADGTDNITPSDVDGLEIEVDGNKYLLKADTNV